MTPEQTIIHVGSEWVREIGPYSFTTIVVLYLYLNEKGYLPRFLSLRKMNGNLSLHTLLNNHVAHLEEDVKYLKSSFEKEITEIKNAIKDLGTKHEVFRGEVYKELNRRSENLDEKISKVHDRINSIGK
jgi:hypothetical protein